MRGRYSAIERLEIQLRQESEGAKLQVAQKKRTDDDFWKHWESEQQVQRFTLLPRAQSLTSTAAEHDGPPTLLSIVLRQLPLACDIVRLGCSSQRPQLRQPGPVSTAQLHAAYQRTQSRANAV
jgi:hypothetical protein